MSDSTYYWFFDRAGLDSIWQMKWQDFFAKFPRLKAGFTATWGETLEETTDMELQRLFRSKTLAWALQRTTPQMVIMSDIMPPVIAGKRQVIGFEAGLFEDFFGLLAHATASFLDGRLDRRTYEAVLKLHNLERPSNWLSLSRQQAKRVDGLVGEAKLTTPIYRWQGPGACRETPVGLWHYDVANCLSASDTTRFCSFVEASWEKNEKVQHLREVGRMSVDLSKGTPCFRAFEINRKLIQAIRGVRRMKRPVVMRFST